MLIKKLINKKKEEKRLKEIHICELEEQLRDAKGWLNYYLSERTPYHTYSSVITYYQKKVNELQKELNNF